MKSQSLLQRFMADTPAFEKGAQIFALIMIAVAAHLPGIISPTLTAYITGGGIAVAFFAQFASKDLATIEAAPSLPDGILQVISDLPGQFETLKTAITGTAADHAAQLSDLATVTFDNSNQVAKLTSAVAQATAQPVAAPVVAAPPAPVVTPAPAPVPIVSGFGQINQSTQP